ncbi:MAG: hypothetical protein OHK0031_19090 [Anaerolineales bacterium]
MTLQKFTLWIGLPLALILALAGVWLSRGAGDNQQQARIQAAVAATLARIPSQTPPASPTPNLPPTPISLEGTFCEYGFCIGHPAEIYLVDAATIRNPAAPSTRAYGILFGFSPSLFIQTVWTTSGPAFDYAVTQRYILEEKDALAGSVDVQLVGNLNVYVQAIGPTASDLLPFGAVAVWQCGGRDFAWKVYTPRDGMAAALLSQALQRFRCE